MAMSAWLILVVLFRLTPILPAALPVVSEAAGAAMTPSAEQSVAKPRSPSLDDAIDAR